MVILFLRDVIYEWPLNSLLNHFQENNWLHKKLKLIYKLDNILFKVGGIRWPIFLNEHVIRSHALQHIALDWTEHTIQSLLKHFNVWMLPHGDLSQGCL